MQLLVICPTTCTMSLLLFQLRGWIMLKENKSFCKSYIYLLLVGKYQQEKLSVKLPVLCLCMQKTCLNLQQMQWHPSIHSLQLQDLFIFCGITIQMLFIFNAVLLLVMSNHSHKIRIYEKTNVHANHKPRLYLQYLGESLFPFICS